MHIFSLAALLACSGAADPNDDTAADTDTDTDTDTDSDSDVATVSYASDVWPILEAECSGCHQGGYQPNLVLTDAPTAYASLVSGVPNTSDAYATYVTAGDADGSLLIDKIEADPAYGGMQMPVAGTYPDLEPDPLSADQITTIRTWIAEGALDN